jgi:hypothetical protein
MAGRFAARYTQKQPSTSATIQINPENGIRYTVPNHVDPSVIQSMLVVRFRVTQVYENHFVVVRFDDVEVSRKQKRILTPGEMEQIILPKAWFVRQPDLKNITIRVEKEGS